MKATRPLLFASLLLATLSCAGTPPITVPPNWAMAPQEQASHLAVPDQAPMPKTVLAIVLCNNIVGLAVVDDVGELHPYHFDSKEMAEQVLHMVPADHAKSINVGCPTNATKDTTVL